MDKVLKRCGRKKGGYPSLCKEGWGNNNAKSHKKHFARTLRFEVGLYIIIIPIALDKLDTEMLAAHYIISHSSSDILYTQP